MAASRSRGSDRAGARSAFPSELRRDGAATGFVKRATEAIEARSRSTTVPPRSASTTGSEASGKRQRTMGDLIAIEAVVAEKVATAESAPDSPAPPGRKDGEPERGELAHQATRLRTRILILRPAAAGLPR